MVLRALSYFRRHSAQLLLLFFGVLVPLLVLGELSGDVRRSEEFPFDAALLTRLHALSSPALDGLALTLRFLGGVEALTPISVFLVAAFLHLRQPWRAAFVAASMLGAVGFNLLAKAYFARPRPTLFDPLIAEPNFSFPSGHATGSAAFGAVAAVLLWHTRWRWAGVAFGVTFALLVGFSRPYLGAHYPSDVLGGWMSGLAWVVGLRLVMRPRLRVVKKPSDQGSDSISQ